MFFTKNKMSRLSPFVISGVLLLNPLAISSANAISAADLNLFEQAKHAMSEHNWIYAERLLSQLHLKYPNSNQINNNLAISYFNQGRMDEAQDLFATIIKSNEQTRIAFENLQSLYGYSAAKAYSKGLNLLKPIDLPKMTMATQLDGSSQNVATLPAKQTEQLVASLDSSKINSPRIDIDLLQANKEKAKTAKKKDDAKKQATAPKKKAPKKKAQKNDASNQATSEELEQQVLDQLDKWAYAWSKGDYQGYIDSYTADYSPRRLTREKWLKNRKARVKPSKQIDIDINNAQVYIYKDRKRANVLFDQNYRSKNYSDKVQKRVYWVKRNDSWLINKEIIIKPLN